MPGSYTSDEIIEFMQENWADMYCPAHDLVVYMNRVQDLGLARAREVLSGFDLTLGEFDILTTLRRSPAPHVLLPKELQRSLLITSGGLTKLLYQLEASGLVSRSVREKDKRCKRVHLTPKGKKITEEAMVEVQGARNAWLNRALSRRELGQLRNLLSKTARVLESREPGNA